PATTPPPSLALRPTLPLSAFPSWPTLRFFFFSSRRRHTRSVSAFLLNRSSDLFLHCIQMDTSVNAANQVVSVGADIAFDADPKFFACLVRFESSSVPTTLPTAYDVYPLDGRHDGG